MMAGRRSKYDADVHRTIVKYITDGAFDWVASEAAGIGKSTFYRWLESGEKYPKSRYREFWEDVCKARADARMSAEIKVKRDNPFNWLRYGPGRDRPGAPGWTEQQQITGPDSGPVEIKDVSSAESEVASRIDSLAARLGTLEGISGAGEESDGKAGA